MLQNMIDAKRMQKNQEITEEKSKTEQSNIMKTPEPEKKISHESPNKKNESIPKSNIIDLLKF